MRHRLLQHRRKPKLDWTRAVAIKRDNSHGFNSAETGYLEGRLASELRTSPSVEVIEGQQTLDTTLPPHLLLGLDELIPSTLAALRVYGLDLYKPKLPEMAEDEAPGGQTGKLHTPKLGTVADLVASGLLPAGSELHLSQGGRTASATVTTSGDIVVDGVAHGSPSRAAATSLGLQSANGWTTWHVGDMSGPTLDHLRAQLPTM